MKKKLLFAIAGITLMFMSVCEDIHNPFLPEKTEKGITFDNPEEETTSDNTAVPPVVIDAPAAETFTIVINISDAETGDTVTASPDSGKAGDTVTLGYTVANTKHYNLLDFGGVTAPIASVSSAGSGERTYTINAADASGGVITITAIFTHTDLVPDPIEFTDTAGHINKTYGDAAFTNAVAAGYLGSGEITYSSEDTSVATVDGSGQVTILKAGSTVIIAEKAADAVYAHARAEYTLAVNQKPVTITGLSAANKQYDGSTAATVTGVAVISGLVGGDAVTVSAGTATFANATVGNGKSVTFSGWSLTGADAGNYTLSAQPASVTADIEFVSMVSIPAGTFMMGSPTSEPNRSTNETQHSVMLTKSFYMSAYQVTQAQYQAVMGAGEDRTTTTYGKGDNYPIYDVNWYDAIVFCNKLSIKEELDPVYSIGGSTDPVDWGAIPTSSNTTWNGAVMDVSKNGYRLPTEAEWEYACRGSYTNKATETNTKPFGIGDGTKITGSMANFYGSNPYDLARSGAYTDTDGTYLGRTTTVGSYNYPNNYGLYDMHGNLYEWCWDWYGAYSSSPANAPIGPDTGTNRVLRGGGWYDSGQNLRSASRIYYNPNHRHDGIGFRLVRS